MSYKYYKINFQKCDNIELSQQIIIELSYRFECLGVQQLDIDENQVDQILGGEAFVTGEVGAEIINKIDSSESDIFVYFAQNTLTNLFEDDLENLKCIYILIDNIVEEDWNSSWKKSYSPIMINNQLTIYPSWYKNTKKVISDDYVFIYPGMGFGTGTHETTFQCLEFIYKYSKKISSFKSCLDLGCGSGVLGIVAQKYFNLKTVYCDIDNDALTNTDQNLKVNDLYTELIVNRKFLKCQKYDLLFANIILSELIVEKEFIIKSLNKDGILILSGILNEQVDEILSHYSTLSLLDQLIKNDWSCLALRK